MENVGTFYDHLCILIPFEIFCGHLVYFMDIWYIFRRFGMLHQEKSGNPDTVFSQKQRLSAEKAASHIIMIGRRCKKDCDKEALCELNLNS
jgi:hypothetical protein